MFGIVSPPVPHLTYHAKGNHNMTIGGEVKLLGDHYAGGFSCGLTMGDSGTMERFQLVRESGNEIVYQSEDPLILTVTETDLGEATAIHTRITNSGSRSVTMEMLSSFLLKDVPISKLYRLQSCWSAEGKLRSESITDLHLEKSWNGCAYRIEKFGNVGSMPVRKYFPFLAIENSETGEFLGVQLYLASSWQIEIRCRDKDTYTIAGGIADRDFGQWMRELKPGETFEAPKAVIARGSSLLDVCDKLVKAQHPLISEQDQSMEIMFNEYCTTWGNPSYENVKRICDKIADKGIRFLVIDSGWYGKSDNWWNRVGDWYVNEERFPGGMKAIADYIRSKGMIPGLWFEMESVTSGASNYRETDHLVKKDGYPLTVGNRRFWDMEDPWAIEYLTKSVIGTLRDAEFGYLKVDYNDTMGMGCDPYAGGESRHDGPGENLRRKVEASREFFRTIAREIPGIVIENCSSGGHRLEPSMMELVSQASFSDAHETTAIPLIAANMHRVIPPRQSQIWAVMRAGDSDARIFYSIVSTFLGRMCLSGDIYNMSEHQWELIEDGIAFYRQVSDIIRDGRTVLIDTNADSYNTPCGQQLVIRELGHRGMLIFHRFEHSLSIEEALRNMDSNSLPGIAAGRPYRILAAYGQSEEDFSAEAWYYEYES